MNNQLKQLEKIWYDKLAEDGFEDIEDKDHNLKQTESLWFQSIYGPEKLESNQEYFRLVGQFLYEHKFSDPLEKLIWQHYSEGLSGYEISSLLSKTHKKCKKSKIFMIIDRLKKLMIKKYVGVKSE